MSEEILINVTPSETRVALVENGMLQEVMIERSSRRGYVGNIYKGRVSRVLPGMQAAFVDVGLERAAFLHASDIHRAVGNGQEPQDAPDITELVSEGGDVVVQVIKDPISSKGARLTTHISIPSRFLVLMPYSQQVGVSVRIEDEEERQRLRTLLQDAMSEEETHGYIVRTNAEGVDQFAIRADLAYLKKLWEKIREDVGAAEAGDCVYEDLSLDLRALRDTMTADVDRVRIDATDSYRRVIGFAQRFIPQWAGRIELFSDDRPIFDLYGVEDDIQNALRRHVPLKSGGHIVFDQTEAMTTIDVNTGGFIGHRNLEETIFKTNLEAAQTIARQLRLRNLGGIIIIDFIDMTDEDHKVQLLRTLQKALAKDHAKTFISNISPLGLVEMTRKRTTESLERVLCEPCPACSGRGTMKTAETIVFEIFREITRAVRQFEATELLVMAAPTVVDRILDEESATLADLEGQIAKTIRFQSEDQYTQEQFDVVLL
ncbi:MAG: ribonuclease G [Xanthomonadales bacterium]|nr:ribonuclease G [Xanthomonadales bacterium]